MMFLEIYNESDRTGFLIRALAGGIRSGHGPERRWQWQRRRRGWERGRGRNGCTHYKRRQFVHAGQLARQAASVQAQAKEGGFGAGPVTLERATRRFAARQS